MDEIIANIQLNLFDKKVNDELKFVNNFIESYSYYLKYLVKETDVYFNDTFNVTNVFEKWKNNKQCFIMAEFVIIMALNHALMQVCDNTDKWHYLDFKSLLFCEHSELFFSTDGTLVSYTTLIIMQSKAKCLTKISKRHSRRRFHRQNKGVGLSVFKFLKL